MVFEESLAWNWGDESWDAVPDFAATSVAHEGATSMAFSVTAPWGALYLVSSEPVDCSHFSHLSFAARASQPGAGYSVWVVDANGARIGQAVTLDNLGGQPVADGWLRYEIPLDLRGLAIGSRTVSGIIIQDNTNGPQPQLYIDELGFLIAPPE
jgi:hypothetical protein